MSRQTSRELVDEISETLGAQSVWCRSSACGQCYACRDKTARMISLLARIRTWISTCEAEPVEVVIGYHDGANDLDRHGADTDMG